MYGSHKHSSLLGSIGELETKESVVNTTLSAFEAPSLFFCGSGWTRTYGLGMVRHVFYHCATTTGNCHCLIKLIKPEIKLCIKCLEATNTSLLGSIGELETKESVVNTTLSAFEAPSLFFCGSGWTRTYGLGMVRHVFYHCATTTGYCHCLIKLIKHEIKLCIKCLEATNTLAYWGPLMS